MTQFDPRAIEAASKAAGSQPPALYGTDEHIASLVRRMRYLIPGATDAPDPVIWRAGQIAAIHGLDPFSGDIWIYSPYENPKDDQWIVDVGVAAWRRAAQRQAKYTCTFAELSADEVQQRMGADYTPEDVGYRCTLYRLDVAKEAAALHIPYEPTVAYGFWRKRAFKKRDGQFVPDKLANTETREDKAKKRAEKKALKIAFSLDFPDERLIGAGDESTWRVLQNMEQQTATEERVRAPLRSPNEIDYSKVDRTQPDWDIFIP